MTANEKGQTKDYEWSCHVDRTVKSFLFEESDAGMGTGNGPTRDVVIF